MISAESTLTFWKLIRFEMLEETVEEYSRKYLAGYWQEGDPSLVVTCLASGFSFVDVDHSGVLRCCDTSPFCHKELKSSVSLFMMIAPVCIALYFVSFLTEPLVVHCAKFPLDSVSYSFVRIFSGFWFWVILTGSECLLLFREKLLNFFVVFCEPVLISFNGSS